MNDNNEQNNIEEQALYSIYIDCGRMGSIEGKFQCLKSEWAEFKEKYNDCHINLYDYLGKHSEISLDICDLEPKLVTDDQNFLNMAISLGVSLDSGFCPLDYEYQLEEQLSYKAGRTIVI
jgi:hypothetical protein